MKEKIREMQSYGVDFWNDSCDLDELKHAVEMGATGATSNPVIVSSIFAHKKEIWTPSIQGIIRDYPHLTEEELAWKCIEFLGVKAASILLPIFEKTQGRKGKLSLQTSPRYYNNWEKIFAHGQHLASLAPNIAIKIPALPAGIKAMEKLTEAGVSVNATVSFSVSQALAAAEAIERGIKQRKLNGSYDESLSPYVTIMIGRVDDYINQRILEERLCIEPGIGSWSGIAVFKKAHKIFKERSYHSQLLAAAYRHHLHWSELIGENVIQSIPYKHWNNFNNSSIKLSSELEHEFEEQKLSSLLQCADFHKVYQTQGLSEDEFLSFGATKNTLHQFLSGLDQLQMQVRELMISV